MTEDLSIKELAVKYPYIPAYGQYNRSANYIIEERLKDAYKSDVPENVIYKNYSFDAQMWYWVTFEELLSIEQERVLFYVKKGWELLVDDSNNL